MKKITLLVILIVHSISFSISAENHIELAEQYMKIAGVDEMLSQYSYAYTVEAKRIYSDLPNTFWESEEYLKIMSEYEKELWSEWKNAYKEKITESDLKQMIEFMKTDLGKKFLNLQKEIQPVFTEVSIKAGAKLNDKFTVLIKSYRKR